MAMHKRETKKMYPEETLRSVGSRIGFGMCEYMGCDLQCTCSATSY